MEIFPNNPQYDFMRYRHIFVAVSFALMGLAIFFWFQKGEEKYGVDFTGGSLVVVRFEQPTDIAEVRKAIETAQIVGAEVQAFEGSAKSEFSVRSKEHSGSDAVEKVTDALRKIEGKTFTLLKQEFVGPTMGEQIRKDGIKALVIALVGMLIYMTIRFEFRFAVGAVFALLHDVVVAAGFYVFSGRELSTGVIAALLTIVGYSVNDTIVVYDRIRENMAKSLKSGSAGKSNQKGETFIQLVNRSTNETLARTVLTVIATQLVVATLWLMAGGVVSDIALTLLIGFGVGCYSSIFVAAPIVIAMGHDAPELRQSVLNR